MEDRIAKLERRCRHLTAALGLLIAGVLLVPLMGADEPQKVDKDFVPSVSTSVLKILDKNGKPRILLSAANEEPSILVSSRDGKMAYWLVAQADGSIEQSLVDKLGKTRIQSRVAENGTALFSIYDPRGEARAVIFTEPNNSVSSVMIDGKGDPVEVPFGKTLK